MTDYTIAGQCNQSVVPSATTAKISARGINGFTVTRAMPLANLSKPVIVPANWISRQYQCELTGSPNLILPIASFSASLTVSGGSTLSVVVPITGDLLDAIIARKTGDIIISRVHLYSDGSTAEREFIRVNFNSLSSATAPKAGTTVTLQGTKTIKAKTSKPVYLTDAMFRSFSGGAIRYRCAVNDEVALGDTAIINSEQLIAGKITYSVNSSIEFMEISEYQADGADLSSAIGSNARPLPLSKYSVTTANANYDLWLPNALNYGSISASDYGTGQTYTLYNDSTGLLWYLDGFEGASNIPVYLSDGVTQAIKNV